MHKSLTLNNRDDVLMHFFVVFKLPLCLKCAVQRSFSRLHFPDLLRGTKTNLKSINCVYMNQCLTENILWCLNPDIVSYLTLVKHIQRCRVFPQKQSTVFLLLPDLILSKKNNHSLLCCFPPLMRTCSPNLSTLNDSRQESALEDFFKLIKTF